MTNYPRNVLGNKLKVGDVIEVWWSPNQDTIVSLKPYHGRLEHLFPNGAQLAKFVINKTGMTIENGGRYKVLSRRGNQ